MIELKDMDELSQPKSVTDHRHYVAAMRVRMREEKDSRTYSQLDAGGFSIIFYRKRKKKLYITLA